MEVSEKTLDNRFTFRGKHYYMINDFAEAIGKTPNNVYQMIHRGNISPDRLLKLHKIIFISDIELNERVKSTSKIKELEKVFDTKKSLRSMSDTELVQLKNVLDKLCTS